MFKFRDYPEIGKKRGSYSKEEIKELFAENISVACHSLYSIGLMLWPIMPKKMEQLLSVLGQQMELGMNYDEELRKNIWDKVFVLK